MSYGSKFKGKLVWGTSVFRILLETSMSRLKADFTGTLTLFERRHEKTKYKFHSLDEFINQTRELWKESLRSDTVQDTRLSRWIEEYFGELGVSANYQEILDAIRGDFEEVPPLEVTETENLDQDHVNNLLPPNDEFMASGITQKIQGDFSNKEELNKILSNFLDEHKPKRQTEALSSATFTTADGQTKTIEDRKTIADQPLDDTVKLSSGFANDFGMEINDISFTDTVPFDYEIQDVSISGVEAQKIGQEVTRSGLEVKWQIDKLGAGEKSEIEYQLGKRMLRTILIRDDYDLTILQTYENINRDNNSVWIESTYVFQDNTPIVENVKILDQIPGDYNLVNSTPQAVPPMALVTTTQQSTEIAWSYTEVPASTQFVLSYELASSSKILRDRLQLFGPNDELYCQAVRLIRPEKSGEDFGVIMALKAFQEINKPISIIERLPLSVNVSEIEVKHGQIVELQRDDTKEVHWKIDNIAVDETIEIYLRYQGSDKVDFDKITFQVGNDELQEEEVKDSIKKDTKLVLPDQIYSSI